MQSIPINDIQLGERVRKDFDEEKINELADSIADKGLMQAPVLKADGKTLLSGERRLRAIHQLNQTGCVPVYYNGQAVPEGYIPFVSVTDLSEIQLLEAELEENVIRQDLTWQERVDATKRLHDLRQEQHTDQATGKVTWTATQTADEIHGEASDQKKRQNVRDDLVLAEHLDDPDVAGAKDEKEARKILEKKAKQQEYKKRAQEAKAYKSPHILHHGSAFDLMPQMEANSVDVICTDPPYGIDVHKKQWRDGDYHEYDDSEEALDEAINLLAYEGFRIAKDQAHVYVFCDIRMWPQLVSTFWLAGWEVWERPLIWYKGNTGSFGGTDWGPRRTYEAILYAAKGRRPVTALYHDVIDVTKPTQTEHPAAKPTELFENLLRRSAYPGDWVLDPFCGGGPIFSAAEKLSCYAVGMEISDQYYNLAAANMKETIDGSAVRELADG